MSAALKAKGPEALERLPSHVTTTPTKEMEMNMHVSITAAMPAATVTDLIDAHLAALGLSDRLWEIAHNIEMSASLPDVQICYAFQRKWNHDTRTDDMVPIYAYSLEMLEHGMKRVGLSALSIFAPRPA